jgi:uncharacterized membrane protein YgdD (TMEM256/DUF423 family)
VIRWTLTGGALFGLLAVALGAFGAHALAGRVPASALETWATASDYLAMHAVALLASGALMAQRAGARLLGGAAACFLAGSVLFSGSLYVLALGGARAWAAVTPFGGTILIFGWGLLTAGVWRHFAPPVGGRS